MHTEGSPFHSSVLWPPFLPSPLQDPAHSGSCSWRAPWSEKIFILQNQAALKKTLSGMSILLFLVRRTVRAWFRPAMMAKKPVPIQPKRSNDDEIHDSDQG